MRRLSFLVLLIFASICACAQGSRVVIVSWDGAADWYLDKMVADGKLPTLKRMKEQGVYAESVIPCNPSITAAGHATIWTGAWPDKHHITGNTVPRLPRAEFAINESMRGFDSNALAAEPIYMSAALAGKVVTVLSATHVFPAAPWVAKLEEAAKSGGPASPSKFMAFSGFESTLYPAVVHDDVSKLRDAERFGRTGKELEIRLGQDTYYAFFARNGDGQYLDCTLYKAADPKPTLSAYLRHGSTVFSPPLDVRKGDDWGVMTFGLLDLAPDLSHFLLYQGASSAIKGHFDKNRGEDYVRSAGGFHDLPTSLYENGRFGKTAWQGGDGTAEQLLLRVIERDFQRLEDGFRWAIRENNPSLVMHYTPIIDTLGHMFMGVLDPDSPRYNKELAEKLTPLYEGAIVLADKWLAQVIDMAGPGAVVAVVSDHGMEGGGRMVSLNRILADAGIVKLKDNRVDVATSKAVSPSWNYFLVNVNGVDWKNGFVRPEEREGVIDEVIKTLEAYRDPETGKPVVLKAMRASEVVGGGGPAGGDVYVQFAPGYHPTSRLLPSGAMPDEDVLGSGNHGFEGSRMKMRSIFYAIGPGLAAGRNLGEIRQIDIAPSLAILGAIPTPADSIGTNLRLTQRN